MQLLEDSVEERMEKALSDSDRAEAESKDADAEDNNKARNSLIVWDSCYIMFVICSLPLKPGHSFFVNTQQHVFVLLFCCYLKNRNAVHIPLSVTNVGSFIISYYFCYRKNPQKVESRVVLLTKSSKRTRL
jgi:hypothetical protein